MNNLVIPQNEWSLNNFSKWDKIDPKGYVSSDPFVWHPGKDKAIETESRSVAAWDWREGMDSLLE